MKQIEATHVECRCTSRWKIWCHSCYFTDQHCPQLTLPVAVIPHLEFDIFPGIKGMFIGVLESGLLELVGTFVPVVYRHVKRIDILQAIGVSHIQDVVHHNALQRFVAHLDDECRDIEVLTLVNLDFKSVLFGHAFSISCASLKVWWNRSV